MSQHPKAKAKLNSAPKGAAASGSAPPPATKTAAQPSTPSAAKASAPSHPQTSPQAPKASLVPTIFLPTLLPSLLEESSPELCWEWTSGGARLAARLTQFGWNASAYAESSAIGHWRADSLEELRAEIRKGRLPAAFSAALAAPWALAYDVAGFE